MKTPKKKIYAEKRKLAYELYLNGDRDHYSLAEKVGCAPVTIKKWIEKYNWAADDLEYAGFKVQAELARQRAYITALQTFADDPLNFKLQDLVKLLEAEKKRTMPSKELNDYIVVFLDQVTDYLLENDMLTMLKEFQKIIHELSEYLRKRNQ